MIILETFENILEKKIENWKNSVQISAEFK